MEGLNTCSQCLLATSVLSDFHQLLTFLFIITYGLLTKFVRSRWLDIGQVLFLRVYGPRRIKDLLYGFW